MKYYDSDTHELNKDNVIKDLKKINDYLDKDMDANEALNILSEITASFLLYNIDKK